MGRWGKMSYDLKAHRWIIHHRGHLYPLRGGEWFGLSIGKHSIPCQLEMDQEWFIVMPGARFYLRIGDIYKVEI